MFRQSAMRAMLLRPCAVLLQEAGGAGAPVKVDLAALKELRFRTEAPVRDCNDALKASGNDLEAAMVWLKQKGLHRAQGKKERVTDHGVMLTVVVPDRCALALQLCCETDFSAGNSRFLAAAEHVRATAQQLLTEAPQLATAADDALLTEVTAKASDVVGACMHVLGENIALRRKYILEQPADLDPALAALPTAFGGYAHSTVAGTSAFVGKTVGLASVRMLPAEDPANANAAASIGGRFDVADLAQHCVASAGDDSELVHQRFMGSDASVGKWLKSHGARFASSMVIEFGKDPKVTFAKNHQQFQKKPQQ